jgi:hypothetical protein
MAALGVIAGSMFYVSLDREQTLGNEACRHLRRDAAAVVMQKDEGEGLK